VIPVIRKRYRVPNRLSNAWRQHWDAIVFHLDLDQFAFVTALQVNCRPG
jgi:hypothetical protein